MEKMTRYFIVEGMESIIDAVHAYGQFSDGHESAKNAKSEMEFLEDAKVCKVTIEVIE